MIKSAFWEALLNSIKIIIKFYNKIKKEEKVITKKIEIKPVITTNTNKKINISENMSNYKRKK